MAKTVVFDSPYQSKVLNPATGLVFERGVPKVVSDEQAAILLEKHTNPYLEGTNEDVAKLKIDRPNPNPLVGQQKNPYFSEVAEEAATPTPVAPAPFHPFDAHEA